MTTPRPLPPRPRRSQPPLLQVGSGQAKAPPRRSSPPPPPKRDAAAKGQLPKGQLAKGQLPKARAPKVRRRPQPAVVTSAPPMDRVTGLADEPTQRQLVSVDRPRPQRPRARTSPEVARQRAAEARERREAATRRVSPQMQELHPGDVIAGRYRIDAIMGRSRGLLLDCSHTGFDQRAAIRVISPALADSKAVDRFQREIRILSKLESEHVARIVDVGTLPNGALYLARQHLEGTSLSDETRGHGMPVCAAVDQFLQVAEAVAEAHGHGVVLRDLQSSHVFVTRKRNGEPVAKLTDFGTCKVMKKRDGELSCTRLLGLSPSASPELIRQQSDIDERADIWSLACMLYEMLTGGPAFLGEGTALMLAIAQDAPVPPSSLRRDVDVPSELDRIILRALEKRPADRFRTVYDMVRGLRPFASRRGQVLIEQIARLAGEEPTAVSQPPMLPAPSAIVEEDTDDSMSFSVSVNPSEPQRGSVPPAAAIPVAVPAPAVPSAPSHASGLAPSPSHGGGFRPGPARVASSPSAPTLFPWEMEMGAPARSRKLKVAALLAALPMCLLLVVIALGGEPEPSTAQASLSLPSYDAIAAEVGAAEPTEADTSDSPAAEADDDAASDDGAAEPRDEAVASTTRAQRRAAKGAQQAKHNQFLTSLGGKKASSKRASSKRQARRDDRPAADASKPEKSEATTGTLVAMAVGASCSFAIDGSPRGSSSSVRATVPAGVHTVSCAPISGASRSRSVTVAPGKASVAVFKF